MSGRPYKRGMPVRNETLYDLCKQALTRTLDYIHELISKGEKYTEHIQVNPIIEKDQFRGLSRHISINKGEILERHMSEIEKLPQVKKLSEFLNSMNNNKKGGIKIRKIVSDYLSTLFYSYADLKAFPTFDQKEFDQSYKLLEDYMYGTLMYQSFAPLYDFQMFDSRITLDDDFVIRKIKPNEYRVVALKTYYEAPFLKYAIGFRCTIFEYNQKSGPGIDRVITSIRLYKRGAISYCEVYSTPAVDIALGESVKSGPRSLQHIPKYQLKRGEGKKFRRFYTEFNKIIDKIREGSFFNIAIDRFNSALEEKEFADKIIDLSIALEALFSTTSEDLTYKLRIRVSVLLGIDYSPEFLFDFMGKAYGIRSRLVHGKVNKKAKNAVIKMDSKEYSLYDVANELEQITRLSILRMLSLFKHHNYEQENTYLINVIDKVAIGHPRGILGPTVRLNSSD
jgi:hypothetical protein